MNTFHKKSHFSHTLKLYMMVELFAFIPLGVSASSRANLENLNFCDFLVT